MQFTKTVISVLAILPCLLLSTSLQSEIYRWVDDKGRVYYSEDQPESQESENISAKLEEVGNFFKFTDVIDVDWYVPPTGYKSAQVQVQIDLISYQLTKAELRTMRENVAGIYETYSRWFDWPQSPKRPIVIKVFGRFDEFEQYQLEKYNGHSTTRSHYSHRRKEVVMLGTEFTQSTLGVLYHEASHAIMDMKYRSTPNWINEGLAECFENVQVKGKKILLYHNGVWVEKMKHKLREGSLRPLEEYLNISNQAWRASPARVENSYYMIGWSIMSTLLASQQGIESLRAILSNLNNSGWWHEGGLTALFNDSYPGGIKNLDRDWRAWIEAR